jgi:hypothetical protein
MITDIFKNVICDDFLKQFLAHVDQCSECQKGIEQAITNILKTPFISVLLPKDGKEQLAKFQKGVLLHGQLENSKG